MRFRSEKKNGSQFNVDKNFEEITNTWMRENLGYAPIEPQEFVKDKERQLKGIDIISATDGNIDEKALASDLNTFCFELSGNINSAMKGINSGWLLKQSSQTDAYLLEYFSLDKDLDYQTGKKRILDTNGECIRSCESILIQKIILIRTICNYFDIEKEDFSTILEECRKACEKSTNRYFTITNGQLDLLTIQQKQKEQMWIAVSPHLKECPINIVIRKRLLKRIADKVWMTSI